MNGAPLDWDQIRRVDPFSQFVKVLSVEWRCRDAASRTPVVDGDQCRGPARRGI